MEISRSAGTHLAMQMSRRKVARIWGAGSGCRCPACPCADLWGDDPPRVGLCCWSGIRASSSRRCSSCIGPPASTSAILRVSAMSSLGRCGSKHVVDGSAYQIRIKYPSERQIIAQALSCSGICQVFMRRSTSIIKRLVKTIAA